MAEELEKLRELLRVDDIRQLVWAIRGPDIVNGDTLKEALTLPIRHVIFFGKDPNDEILEHMTPINLDLIFETLQDMEGNLAHYVSHICWALSALWNQTVLSYAIYNYARNYIDVIHHAWFAIRNGKEEMLKKAKERAEDLRQYYHMLWRERYGTGEG